MNASNITSKFWEDLKSGRFASMVKEASKGQSLSNPEEVYNIIKPLFAQEDDVEKMFVIFLDSQNKILSIENLFSGSINSSAIYCRELIKRIIQLKATAIVLAHNHPSGDTTPSSVDKLLTIKIGFAVKSIDVRLHEHIIIGDGFYSMHEHGLMEDFENGINRIFVEYELKTRINYFGGTTKHVGKEEHF